jgi:hypothetical protein
VDNEIALAFIRFVEILLWVDLENVVTQLKPNWLHFRRDLFTWLGDVAEGFVRFAIKLRQA